MGLLAALVLVAILGVAGTGQALTIPTAGGAGSLSAPASPSGEEAVAAGGEGEGEDGEEEEPEGCEEDDEEGEEEAEAAGDGDGKCKGNPGPGGAKACPLRSAEATVFVYLSRSKIRLQIRYRATSPTVAAIDYGLHGGRGSLQLGGAKKQFAGQGVLRLNRSLTGAQMGKVRAARGFTVRIRVRACHIFVRQLTTKRATAGGLTWLQSR